MAWSGPWVLVRGVEETGRDHSTGRVGQAPETRIRRVIGRKKYKCVQVKLIELGLCLEIAIDTLSSTFSIPIGSRHCGHPYFHLSTSLLGIRVK
jgi:hypothetical protein